MEQIPQTQIDADIAYFKSKLEQAVAANHLDGAEKLRKQIDLLEDSLVIYKLTRRQFMQLNG